MRRSLRNGVGALLATIIVLASASGFARQRGELDLTVEAPASLAPAADRVRRMDREQLAKALARVGLNIPPQIHVTLIAENDLRARAIPVWTVGLASGLRDIAIFPERIGSYPYDSLESVVWHEVVHLALAAQAGNRPLPRWFHEGVAMSVERDGASRVRCGCCRCRRVLPRDPSGCSIPIHNRDCYRIRLPPRWYRPGNVTARRCRE